MALSILCKDKEGYHHEFIWYVGQVIPITNEDDGEFDLYDIISIQANEKELEYIKELFTNYTYSNIQKMYSIPIPNKTIVTWYGDIAKTIIDNL